MLSTVVVAVDVGKSSFAVSVTDAMRTRLFGPVQCTMTAPAVREMLARVGSTLPAQARVKVGIEAAGHYHRPLLTATAWPAGWEILELNPAHVTEQRRVQGRRRVKTDAVDLEAITELVLTGRGVPAGSRDVAIGELTAWAAHRARRIATRTATKNQLLGQLDRSFPGLTLGLPDVLGTKVGRLVAAEFADPTRLAALGVARFVRFAAARGLQVRRPVAERLVQAARDVLPLPGAAVARQVLAADLALLSDLDHQISQVDAELDRLLPGTPFTTLTSVPGWGVVRAAKYGAAVGDPDRWPSPRQLYRAAGLSPAQYESAGKRRDGAISREGSVELRRALIDLGVGLWHCDPPAKAYAATLKARGKHGEVIACALAHRANSPWCATRRATTRPAGPEHTTAFLDRCQPAGGEERSTWSARSEARTNDIDGDEHRRTLRQRGRATPSPSTPRKEERPLHTLHNYGRWCQAGPHEGPDQTP